VAKGMYLKIPADRSIRPWRLAPIGQGAITICAMRPGMAETPPQ
jgi:hypothetical protein